MTRAKVAPIVLDPAQIVAEHPTGTLVYFLPNGDICVVDTERQSIKIFDEQYGRPEQPTRFWTNFDLLYADCGDRLIWINREYRCGMAFPAEVVIP